MSEKTEAQEAPQSGPPPLTYNVPPECLSRMPKDARTVGNALAPYATYDHGGEWRKGDLVAGAWNDSKVRWADKSTIPGYLPGGRPDTIRERAMLGHPEYHPSDHPLWTRSSFQVQDQEEITWRNANEAAKRMAKSWAMGPWETRERREMKERLARNAALGDKLKPNDMKTFQGDNFSGPDTEDKPEKPAAEDEVKSRRRGSRLLLARAKAERQAKGLLGEVAA